VAAANSSAREMDPRNPPSSFETSLIDAPNERMSAIRSALIQSGMKIVTGCPSARPTAQNEMPVLPLVASTIRPPGSSSPDSYARRMMCSAVRSLMLPACLGFRPWRRRVAARLRPPRARRRASACCRQAREVRAVGRWRRAWSRESAAHHETLHGLRAPSIVPPPCSSRILVIAPFSLMNVTRSDGSNAAPNCKLPR